MQAHFFQWNRNGNALVLSAYTIKPKYNIQSSVTLADQGAFLLLGSADPATHNIEMPRMRVCVNETMCGMLVMIIVVEEPWEWRCLNFSIQTFGATCRYVQIFRHIVYPIQPVTANEARKTVNFISLAPANNAMLPPIIAAAHRICAKFKPLVNCTYMIANTTNVHMNIQRGCRWLLKEWKA